MERSLHQKLDAIREDLIDMGGRVEEMIETATRALVERDDALVERVIESDEEIDALEVEIDDDCHSVLALAQPTAVDMRFVVAVMKITGDLERMGDSAVNIVESVHALNREAPVSQAEDIPRLSERAKTMVRESLDAFVQRDARLAKRVCEADDAVDDLYDELFGEFTSAMREETGATVTRALHLLLVARNLERIADHATNIAEDVIFYVEGRDIRHGVTES